MQSIIIGDVIAWKYGHCADTEDGKITAWRHKTIEQPDEIQLVADLKEYISYQASILYQKKRAMEYPSIEDQLDALWQGGKTLEEMRVKVLRVKEKYPKPV